MLIMLPMSGVLLRKRSISQLPEGSIFLTIFANYGKSRERECFDRKEVERIAWFAS